MTPPKSDKSNIVQGPALNKLLDIFPGTIYCSDIANLEAISYLSKNDLLRNTSTEIAEGSLKWADLLDEHSNNHRQEKIKQCCKDGKSFQLEYQIKRKDGTIQDIREVGQPVLDDSGRIIAIQGYLQDIDDEKQDESDLKSAKINLSDEIINMQDLHQLISDLMLSPDLQSAMQEIVDAVVELIGEELGNIQLYYPDEKVLRIVAHTGYDKEFLDHFKEVNLHTKSVCSRTLADHKRVIVKDVYKDELFAPHRSIARSTGFKSVQSTPLLSRSGELLGVLSTHYSDDFPLKEEQLRLLDIYARQAADIIELVKHKEALKESEERFRTIADNVDQMVWMTNKTGWITWYNKRWYEFTGKSYDEMKGWGWQTIHHPDHVQRVVDKFQNCIENGIIWEDVFPIQGKDGEYRWFLSRAVPIHDKAGNILHWFGTNTDITELREAEMQMSYQKSLLEAQQEVSPLGVLVVSPNDEIITNNHKFQEIWKLSDATLATRSNLKALNEAVTLIDDPSEFLASVREAFHSNKYFRKKVPFIDGRTVELFGAPILGKEGISHGYAWFTNDITATENMTRQKDEFISIASHELKTPVTTLKAFTQVLEAKLEGVEDIGTKNILARMDKQLDNLSALINDLLDVTKIEQGKLQLKKEEINIDQLLHDLIEDFQPTAATHNIQIESDKLLKVCADKMRISQVIMNFLTNAIKYSPGQSNILVNATCDGDKMKFSVQDFGMGISQEDSSKVFDRFYRVGGSGYETYPGLGLGLYISAEIIRRHNGTIGVESIPGRGSTFYFLLPRMV